MKLNPLILTVILILVSCDTVTSDPGSSYEPPQQQGETFWWNESVFYEIFVRSFYDSDGDGIGDLQGIIQKLDYLNDGDSQTTDDLGITGIWLMPVFQSPSYHGYDVIDYNVIEEDYGSGDDFLQFIEECHARGIKVIVDLVMNHCSSQHPWFEAAGDIASEYHDWFRWSDFHPGYTGPWGQPVWHLHNNGSYYYGLFWGGMPDINFNNQDAKTEILDIASFWLTDYGLDGYRCDAVKYIYEDGSILENTDETLAFWEDFREHYKAINPDAMAVGEAWDNTSIVLQYVDNRFDFCFEFELAENILSSASIASPSLVQSKMSEIKDLYPYHQYGTFLTNHDQNRVIDVLGDNIEKARLAACVYLTLPGVPYLYYGEEIAMSGSKPDPDIRRPMQWTGGENAGFSTSDPWHELNDNYQNFNVEAMKQDPGSIWHTYRKLIELRSNNPELSRGTYQAINDGKGSLYSFLREFEGEGIFVLINFTNAVITDPELSIAETNLTGGEHEVIEIWNNENSGTLIVGENGSLENWIPVTEIAPRSILLFKTSISGI